MKLANVMVGEVWVCSGQSNMEMRLCHVKDAPNEVAAALNRNIRLFQVTNDLAPDPQKNCEARWEDCRPSTAYLFSAAAYFFGREIQRELNVPVGLIHASWGGTTAETWMRLEGLRAHPELGSILDYWAPILKSKSPELLAYHPQDTGMGRGCPSCPLCREAHPADVCRSPETAGIGLLRPLGSLLDIQRHDRARGSVRHTGRDLVSGRVQFRAGLAVPHPLPGAHRGLASGMGRRSFSPFVFVQLANFGQRPDAPVESAWAELREAQFMTLAVPNTALATAVDIGGRRRCASS